MADPTQRSDPAAATRWHALDAVRAFALLLGVVFHAAESFGPDAIEYWAVGDRSTSMLLDTFRHASHSFRLELFFLIAGFFAHLVWTKRGIGGFVRNRTSRILVPFVVGWMLLYPLLVFLWLTGVAKTGQWQILGIPEEFRSAPPWQLALGFFITGQFLREFDLTHLWFLHQLLVLYAVALAVRWAVVRVPGKPNTVVARLDRTLSAILRSPGKVCWFAALTLPLLYIQKGWSVDTPKESLLPELPTTLLFGLFFAVGWGVHRQPGLLDACRRHWPAHLALGLLLVVPSRFMVGACHEAGLLDRYFVWIRIGHCALYSLMMWSFVFGFMGLFLEFCRGESPAWRYVADASYWVYLVHLPLVVALQIWVADWPLSWMLKFPLIVIVAAPILFLSYRYLVRSTFVGRQLNGRRYPFRPLWRKRGPARGATPALEV